MCAVYLQFLCSSSISSRMSSVALMCSSLDIITYLITASYAIVEALQWFTSDKSSRSEVRTWIYKGERKNTICDLLCFLVKIHILPTNCFLCKFLLTLLQHQCVEFLQAQNLKSLLNVDHCILAHFKCLIDGIVDLGIMFIALNKDFLLLHIYLLLNLFLVMPGEFSHCLLKRFAEDIAILIKSSLSVNCHWHNDWSRIKRDDLH